MRHLIFMFLVLLAAGCKPKLESRLRIYRAAGGQEYVVYRGKSYPAKLGQPRHFVYRGRKIYFQHAPQQ